MKAVLVRPLTRRLHNGHLEDRGLFEELDSQEADETHHGSTTVDGFSSGCEGPELLILSGGVVAEELGGKAGHGDDHDDSTEVKDAVAVGLFNHLTVNILAGDLAPHALARQDL